MITRLSRRAMLKSTAGSVLLATIGMPAITKAQADAIRIGHLTPLTGFLGPLGEYAVMGVKLAAEEVNAAGGVMGRKIELVMEELGQSPNGFCQGRASYRARQGCDDNRRDFVSFRPCDRSSGEQNEDGIHKHRLQF